MEHQHTAKRKLTAILSADVVGYSHLMAHDDLGTLRRLSEYRGLFSQNVVHYHGRIVDTPGDALLAEFPSAVDAVHSAVEIQDELATRNTQIPASDRMQFRIGINLGDVLEEGGALYGDGGTTSGTPILKTRSRDPVINISDIWTGELDAMDSGSGQPSFITLNLM